MSQDLSVKESDLVDKIYEYFLKTIIVQNEVNAAVDPDWLNKGNAWEKAFLAEAGELLNMLPDWVWWKKIEMDERKAEQACLELADLISFGMSHFIETNMTALTHITVESLPFAVDEMVENDLCRVAIPFFRTARERGYTASDAITYAVDRMVVWRLKGDFRIEAIIYAAECLGFTVDELFGLYQAKACLNKFRQEHGYKAGRYRKHWTVEEDGRVISGEDNVFLAHIVRSVLKNHQPFTDDFTKGVHELLGYYYMLSA